MIFEFCVAFEDIYYFIELEELVPSQENLGLLHRPSLSHTDTFPESKLWYPTSHWYRTSEPILLTPVQTNTEWGRTGGEPHVISKHTQTQTQQHIRPLPMPFNVLNTTDTFAQNVRARPRAVRRTDRHVLTSAVKKLWVTHIQHHWSQSWHVIPNHLWMRNKPGLPTIHFYKSITLYESHD